MTRYEQSKEVIENPDKYHSLDVKEARAYVKGFEDGLEEERKDHFVDREKLNK